MISGSEYRVTRHYRKMLNTAENSLKNVLIVVFLVSFSIQGKITFIIRYFGLSFVHGISMFSCAGRGQSAKGNVYQTLEGLHKKALNLSWQMVFLD